MGAAAASPGETPAQELRARLAVGAPELAGITRLLDGLADGDRITAVRGLSRAQQRALFHAADGALPLELVDLVPASTPDLTPVRHFGRNTLPVFRLFEKRFCRPRGVDAGRPDHLVGYNAQSTRAVTGPGYFVARDDPERPEVLIDYRELPSDDAVPEGWPAVRSNEAGLARFVYGFMVDRLRRVSEHVTIGSASRRGRDLGSWFVLCRGDG